MKIRKSTLLGLSLLSFGAFSFLVCSYDGTKSNAKDIETTIQNTTFLVNLKGTRISLGKEGVEASQKEFEKELAFYIGSENFTITRTFAGVNVVEVKANSKYEELLSTLTNVTHVAVDQVYSFSGMTSQEVSQEQLAEGYVPYANTDTVDVSDDDDVANQSAIAMNVPDSTNGGAGTFIAILDTGYLMDHSYFKNLDNEGLKVSDYSYIEDAANDGLVAQPNGAAAGEEGSLWKNYKIPFYYDYGGSSTNSSNDYDVLSTVSEHGTHVASIAGANGTYKGIAPNAQLALMKVFYEYIPTSTSSTAYTYASDSDIIEALNDCVILGVDALNMSLGSVLDDFDTRSSSMAVIDDLSEDGVVCSVSAGNAGKAMYSSMAGYKAWTTDMVDTGVIGSYSNSDSADIIASSTTEKLFYENGLLLDDGNVIGYSDQVDYTDGTDGIYESNQHLLADLIDEEDLELVIIKSNDNTSTIGLEDDYEAVREAAGGDNNYFNNKIAVVDRGTTSFVDKATAAENAGAAALVVVNNDPTAYEFTFGMSWSSDGSYDVPEIPVVFVLYQDRETIWNYCQEEGGGDDATVYAGDVEIIQDTVSENPNAEEISNFSSDGAKYDLTMIPTIAAPGSSIKGATIGEANSQGIYSDLDSEDAKNSVGYLSGTSMAAPNYTGVIALMIGEYDANIHGDKDEYIDKITARLMSTANIYTHDVTTYGTINDEQSTHNNSTPNDASDDYEVTVYTPDEDETVTETVAYSPRKQGAGVVDVTKALETDVVLEGLTINDDGTYDESKDASGEYTSATGFAKIELKNNELLKDDGKLNFKILAHNNSTSTKTYQVTFSLMTPQLTSYHSSENERANYVSDEAQFEGAQVSSDNDSYRIMNLDDYSADATLVTSYTLNTVSVPTGTNVVELGSYELTDDQKAFITDNFENGTFVEGYITLTEANVGAGEEADTLNVPYMGFYGDYGEADAVEPFAFEKETTYDRTTGDTDGKLYGSDLVNYLGQNSYSKSSMDVGSIITATSYADYQNNNTARSSMLQNNNSPYSYGNTPATTYDEETGEYTLYLGGENTDVLYIQQFVYRSLESATVEIVDELGTTVKSKSITAMYYNTTYLYKSLANSNLISSYIISERGYAELPLYYDNGVKINDGTYTLRFTYVTMYGSTQVKEFNLVLDSGAPDLVSKSVVTINGSSYVRLKFDEIYIPTDSLSGRVIVNAGYNTDYIFTETSDGFIVDIPYNDNTFRNGKLHLTLLDGSRNYARYIINQADLEAGLFVQSSTLTSGYSYSYTVTNNLTSIYAGNIDSTYVVSFADYNGNEASIGTYDAYITFTSSVSSSVQVFGVNEDGTETQIGDVSLLGDSQTIKFTTNYTEFRVVDVSISQSTVTQEYGSVSISSTTNGSVYVDKVSGFVGDKVTVYAVPDDGYKVDSVVVNGTAVSADEYGNYPFYLVAGQNTVVVTFVEA